MEQIRIAVIVTYDRNPLSLFYIPNSIFGTSPILKIGHPLKTSVGLMQHFTIPTSKKEENIYVWACIYIFNFFFLCMFDNFSKMAWPIGMIYYAYCKVCFPVGPVKKNFFHLVIVNNFFFFLTNILASISCMFDDFFETAWPIKTIPFASRRVCCPADPFTKFYCVCFL